MVVSVGMNACSTYPPLVIENEAAGGLCAETSYMQYGAEVLAAPLGSQLTPVSMPATARPTAIPAAHRTEICRGPTSRLVWSNQIRNRHASRLSTNISIIVTVTWALV